MYSIQMQDMARTPDEPKDEPMDIGAVTNRYPYGLCISLDDDQLKKLDLEKPETGDMIHLFAMARVTSVSEREMADGSKCCHVELQITHLGLEDEDQEYGDMMDNEATE